MSYQIKTTRQAEVEAEAIYLWIAQYSPARATLWYFDLQAAIESLANFPARCARAPESQTFGREIRQLWLGKYRVLFHIEDAIVYVTHIRHAARRTLTPEEEAPNEASDESESGE